MVKDTVAVCKQFLTNKHSSGKILDVSWSRKKLSVYLSVFRIRRMRMFFGPLDPHPDP
jgi:hypothetical protein